MHVDCLLQKQALAGALEGSRIPTWCTDTMSPKRTRKFLRTVLFMRIFDSSTVSSAKTMQTVSLRFLPCQGDPTATSDLQKTRDSSAKTDNYHVQSKLSNTSHVLDQHRQAFLTGEPIKRLQCKSIEYYAGKL